MWIGAGAERSKSLSAVQKQYMFLLFLTVGSLGVFVLYLFLPSSQAGPISTRPRSEAKGGPERSPSAVRFVDRTAAAGIRLPPSKPAPIQSIMDVMGSGAGLCDVDGDGDLDLYLVRCGDGETARNRLYLNSGIGTFTDKTEESGADHTGDGMGCVFGDVDNDGDPDLYVTNRGPDAFFLNRGDGTFRDATEEAGLGDPSWGAGAAFGDLDGDGFLDLYVATYLSFDPKKVVSGQGRQFDRPDPVALLPHPFLAEPDRLYRNNRDGTFTDVTRESGIVDAAGKGLGVILSDLDGDGDMDIYVANDASDNLLFANRGDGTFVEAGLVAGLADPRAGMGLAVGDVDNDGRLDLFLTNWSNESNALYLNIPADSSEGLKAVFDDVAVPMGLARPSGGKVGWGTGLFDYDGDGYLDILVVNGYTSPGPDDSTQCTPQPAQLFRNLAGRRFAEAASGEALGSHRNGRGAVFGDIDEDGDIDVVITTNRGDPVLLRNQYGNRNRWLKVHLIGTAGNRDGIGGRITVRTAKRTMVREVRAGSSYLCHSSLEAHFGLGDEEVVESLEVKWPSGRRSHLTGVKCNRTQLVREPEEP